MFGRSAVWCRGRGCLCRPHAEAALPPEVEFIKGMGRGGEREERDLAIAR